MIHFDRSRMLETLENHTLWWEKKLDRALACVTVSDAYDFSPSKNPRLSQKNCHDFSIDPEQFVEAEAANLSRFKFMGDAFPAWNLDTFGPGILAAMLGAKLDNSSGRVWFFPEDNKDISEIHVKYDPENIWAKRIKDIMKTAVEYFDGSVAVGLPDLGGVLDIAASLVESENLLFALIEQPDEVKRLCGEIQTAWHAAHSDFLKVLEPQGCYTDWIMLLSKTPSYVLQCDFSAMISNSMFKEFVLDTIITDTKLLDHTIYHLDGPSALIHLDDLLNIKDLNAIQWQYGAGQPTAINWIDVYRKIHNAGKQSMVVGSPLECIEIQRQVGCKPFCRYNLKSANIDVINKLLSYR